MKQPTLTIDVQDDGKPRLWIDAELLKTYTRNTFWAGKPMETLEILESALIACGIHPRVETPDLDD